MTRRTQRRAGRLAAATAAWCVLLAGALPAQAPVRVMSFNIRYGTANDGAHHWVNRRAAVIATIRDHAPHLLGVQEALRSQLDELKAGLREFQELGVGRDDGGTRGEYAALLVDTLRFEVLASGTFWLSDTPDVPGSMHWGNRITRITTWARLSDRATGDTVRVYNAHWDHESQPARERSASLLLDRVARDGAPTDRVIVVGDFNADETNPAFRALLATGTGLQDSYRVRHPEATLVGTYHAFLGDSTGGKIDAILMGGRWRVLASGIDRRRWGGIWASDHFAVWSVLTAR